jgi:pyruvate dehydrogenase E2 component (dihydrolipoamide acetyltransferase)
MAIEVVMPKLTHEMQQGILIEWFIKEGDTVEKGEPLFSVETDKASVNVEAEIQGSIHYVLFKPGDKVSVGESMAWIFAPGEKITLHEATISKPMVEINESENSSELNSKDNREDTKPPIEERILASPLAKRLAKENKLDLTKINGHGPSNRIIKADVEAYLMQKSMIDKPTSEIEVRVYDVISLSKIEQKIGERLMFSVRTIPHFDIEIEVDMSEINRWRTCMIETNQIKVSYTAFLVKVVSVTLRDYPRINATFVDDKLRVYQDINIGIAIATDHGLVVPVIHSADKMRLYEIQETILQLREKSKKLEYSSSDLYGGTFTLSNLGMFDIDSFHAIINPPEAAILSVGMIKERPVAVDSQIVLRPISRMVLSVDHRIVDGALAAKFLTTLRKFLENPYCNL